MNAHKLIPSMFHRRLVLLLACMTPIVLILSGQLYRLSVVEGAARLAEAESKLDRRSFLPTHRGEIRDRHGRVLARDRASYDIAVNYDVITGVWPRTRAAAQARREVGRSTWNSLSPEQRERAIAARLPYWEGQVDRLWRAVQAYGGIDEHEVIRRRDAIRAEVQSLSAVVWDRQRMEWVNRFGTADDDEDDDAGFRPRPIREQRQPHSILHNVDDETAFHFRRLAMQLDGEILHIQDSRTREHPWTTMEVVLDRSRLPKPIRSDSPITIRVEGVADHIVGSVRDEVWQEDVRRRPFVDPRTGEIDLGGYRVGDIVGSRGLELAFEDRLRGTRGMVLERRDTGEQQRIEPVVGNNLNLTLDIQLQARMQAILSPEFGLTRVQTWHSNDRLPQGRPLNASAVVIDVETGDILAMVSTPTMAMGRRMSESRRRVDHPWVNRAVEAVYPPGSIIKPLVLAAAVEDGRHHVGQPIYCRGHFYETRNDIARCWIYRERFGFGRHGELRAEEAIARSCNVYFYTLADRLGMARLSAWYRRFGLGSPLDVGLLHEEIAPDGSTRRIGENGGSVPDEQTVAALRSRGELAFSSVILGIGQGPITWTPVQAANAYATLARGGIVRDATLVRDDDRMKPRASREHLPLSPSIVQAALEGLRQSVDESHGTGYQIRYDDNPSLTPDRIMNVEGVTVWAKTGTAQAPALPVDTTGDGETDSVLAGLSHAWFVGVVGPDRYRQPTHAIAVIVEYGGSGGRVAGPIANEIVRALKDEGYLGGSRLSALGSRPIIEVTKPIADSRQPTALAGGVR
jgi:penicillin-binding protein 2